MNLVESKEIYKPLENTAHRFKSETNMRDTNIPVEISIKNYVKEVIFSINNQQVLDKLKMTNVALYSTTTYEQGKFVCDLVACYLNTKKAIITDGTACIGGNVIPMMDYFAKVNAVELNEKHADIMINNLSVIADYKASFKQDLEKNLQYTEQKNQENQKNQGGYCNIIHANYLDICMDLKQDVVFLDLPWGGLDYHKQSNIELYLYRDSQNGSEEKVALREIVNELVMDPFLKMIVLKIPKNYDCVNLLNGSKFKFHDIIDILNHKKKLIYRIMVLSNIPRRFRYEKPLFKNIKPRAVKYDLV